MISALRQALDAVERAVEWLIALLMIGLVLIVGSMLVDRHVMTLPIEAPDSYARVMLVWLTFLGFAIAVKGGLNIRVDLIDARLPPSVRRVLEYAFDALMLALAAIIGWNGWRLVELGHSQERLGTVFTEAWPAAAMFGACVLLALFLALRILLRASGVNVVSHHDILVD